MQLNPDVLEDLGRKRWLVVGSALTLGVTILAWRESSESQAFGQFENHMEVPRNQGP